MHARVSSKHKQSPPREEGRGTYSTVALSLAQTGKLVELVNASQYIPPGGNPATAH